MNKKLLIVDVAALSHDFEIDGLKSRTMGSVFPAVTCTVQASFRTASWPRTHGMVSNGVFFRKLRKPMFWEQSAGLVEGPRIWENFRRAGKRVAMLFWQQSLGENVDILLSPAPIHKHHGGMIQGCYSKPSDLYDKLCEKIGSPFKLQRYWGPRASWKVGDWIVDATLAILENRELAPDLCLTYLPSMDYDLQRTDPVNSSASAIVRSKMEQQLYRLVAKAGLQDYDVLVFGDYQIAPVRGAVRPNLALRRAGLMNDRVIKGMRYPDFYSSRAFAVVDHEIAHVYIRNDDDIPTAEKVFADSPGVREIFDRDAQTKISLNHANSGELVLVAEKGKWFAYPWWTRRSEAPDFAGHVDIHNKPGYDPCELFFGWPPGSVSQNTTRIRGSHGRNGDGRAVTWAATFPIKDDPTDLVQLAVSVRNRLQMDIG